MPPSRHRAPLEMLSSRTPKFSRRRRVKRLNLSENPHGGPGRLQRLVPTKE